MVPRSLAIVLVAALAACSSDAGPPGRSAAQKAAAVESCRRAFAEMAREREGPPDVGIVFEGCADLHAAPQCADAWRQAARTTPDRRLATAAAGCRAAYCPHLPTPKPVLCYRQNRDMTAEELGTAWSAFERVVLTRDVGRAGQVVVEYFEERARPVAIPLPAPTEAATPPSVGLRVAREGQDVVVSRSDAPDRKVALAGEPTGDPGRIAPLVEGFHAATITATPALQYQDVLRVMDALREAGVPDVTFSVEAPPQPSP